jgi:hypothetical protein
MRNVAANNQEAQRRDTMTDDKSDVWQPIETAPKTGAVVKVAWIVKRTHRTWAGENRMEARAISTRPSSRTRVSPFQ